MYQRIILISFIWPPGTKLPAGTGGSENYTIGQVRELLRRGIPAQVVTIGLGSNDGRHDFIDLPFRALASQAAIADLEGTVIFVNEASSVQTKTPSFVIMHIPPPLQAAKRPAIMASIAGRTLIATSKYAAQLWADYTTRDLKDIPVAYPFAEACFAAQLRKPHIKPLLRVLFAGRLSAQKGIYTFLEALHRDSITDNPDLVFTVTTAGSDKPEGKIIQMLVNAHPNVTVIPARKTPAGMAELMAGQDLIVMPSNSQYWHETFGIVSIEAQHSGCRVVASNDGGLPETNCGGVSLVKPDDPEALAQGIIKALAQGPLEDSIRHQAANLFTVEQSVDNLLLVLFPADQLVVQPIEKLVLKSSIKVIEI